MPGNILPANPTAVMPYGLCSAFTEEERIEGLVNVYPDGSSDRGALVLNSRHYFKFNRPVLANGWNELRLFYDAHKIEPFYFYNLRETVPPFTWDPTGQNTIGRYTVVWDGQWSDEVALGRSPVTLAVREVQ